MSIFTIKSDEIYEKADFPAFHLGLLEACSNNGKMAFDNDATKAVERAKNYFALADCDAVAYALKQYGAWDAKELSDNDANLGRAIWIIACQLHEDGQAYLGV